MKLKPCTYTKNKYIPSDSASDISFLTENLPISPIRPVLSKKSAKSIKFRSPLVIERRDDPSIMFIPSPSAGKKASRTSNLSEAQLDYMATTSTQWSKTKLSLEEKTGKVYKQTSKEQQNSSGDVKCCAKKKNRESRDRQSSQSSLRRKTSENKAFNGQMGQIEEVDFEKSQESQMATLYEPIPEPGTAVSSTTSSDSEDKPTVPRKSAMPVRLSLMPAGTSQQTTEIITSSISLQEKVGKKDAKKNKSIFGRVTKMARKTKVLFTEAVTGDPVFTDSDWDEDLARETALKNMKKKKVKQFRKSIKRQSMFSPEIRQNQDQLIKHFEEAPLRLTAEEHKFIEEKVTEACAEMREEIAEEREQQDEEELFRKSVVRPSRFSMALKAIVGGSEAVIKSEKKRQSHLQTIKNKRLESGKATSGSSSDSSSSKTKSSSSTFSNEEKNYGKKGKGKIKKGYKGKSEKYKKKQEVSQQSLIYKVNDQTQVQPAQGIKFRPSYNEIHELEEEIPRKTSKVNFQGNPYQEEREHKHYRKSIYQAPISSPISEDSESDSKSSQSSDEGQSSGRALSQSNKSVDSLEIAHHRLSNTHHARRDTLNIVKEHGNLGTQTSQFQIGPKEVFIGLTVNPLDLESQTESCSTIAPARKEIDTQTSQMMLIGKDNILNSVSKMQKKQNESNCKFKTIATQTGTTQFMSNEEMLHNLLLQLKKQGTRAPARKCNNKEHGDGDSDGSLENLISLAADDKTDGLQSELTMVSSSSTAQSASIVPPSLGQAIGESQDIEDWFNNKWDLDIKPSVENLLTGFKKVTLLNKIVKTIAETPRKEKTGKFCMKKHACMQDSVERHKPDFNYSNNSKTYNSKVDPSFDTLALIETENRTLSINDDISEKQELSEDDEEVILKDCERQAGTTKEAKVSFDTFDKFNIQCSDPFNKHQSIPIKSILSKNVPTPPDSGACQYSTCVEPPLECIDKMIDDITEISSKNLGGCEYQNEEESNVSNVLTNDTLTGDAPTESVFSDMGIDDGKIDSNILLGELPASFSQNALGGQFDKSE